MCGIAGIFSKYDNNNNLDRLKRMTNIISHRGPDAEGHWGSDDQKICLGHRRLSIIDLTEMGAQPMHYLDRYTIVFNGEIYNYIELKSFLVQKGYKFHSESDTEVLLAYYDFAKEDCLQVLDGMFAFAIWDEKEKTLFCARDRFGEKPFHYFYEEGKEFIFSSEMKSMWNIGIERKINQKMFYNYLRYQTLTNPDNLTETFYSNIQRLEHSHYLKININDFKVTVHKYYDINLQNINQDISLHQASEKFSELFYSSIKKRMRSDVPIGSSLSGGLDSSLIVCAIDKLNSNGSINQKTFSAQFPGFEKNEANYQDIVINKTKSEAKFTFPDENLMLNEIDNVFYHQEEPFGSSSILVQNEVFKLAKANNVTVLLDGQGADEILGGYHYYYPYFFRELKKNKEEYRKQLNAYSSLHNDNKINDIYSNDMLNKLKYYFPNQFRLARNLKYQIASKGDLSKDFHDEYKRNTYYYSGNNIFLSQILKYNCLGGGLQELLRYADRNSMANSREVRLPFLNHDLVNFLFTLPSTFKINNGWTKYLMRETFKDILPIEICWRKDKIGYEPPQNLWLKNPLIIDKLNENKKDLISLGYLDKNIFNNKKTSSLNEWSLLMAGKLIEKK